MLMALRARDINDEMRVKYALGVQSPESSESIFVTPEIPFGTIMVVLAFLTALGVYRRRLKTPQL